MPDINPEILTWARETAGLSLEEGAAALGLGSTRNKTGTQRLLEFETGEKEPSRELLVKMAEKYRRSLLVFYLNTPPKKGNRGEDFRRLPKFEEVPYDASLDALIRNVQTRHGIVKSLLEDEEVQPLPFIASVTLGDGEDSVAQKIQTTINFDLETFRSQKSISDSFNYLRFCVEQIGIFVLLLGDLGSYQTDIPVDIFRGFAIADPIAPFVIVNDNDARAAWAFTIFHELAHLWLGATGVSGLPQKNQITLEKFCNEVAGRILLPLKDLEDLQGVSLTHIETTMSRVASFAQDKKVSQAMVAYRLFKTNMISGPRWSAINARLNEIPTDKAKIKAEAKKTKGGPDYYIVKIHRLGHAIVDLVKRSVNQGSLSQTKAGLVLGVQPRNVSSLLNKSIQG